jgi:hypothetical protein
VATRLVVLCTTVAGTAYAVILIPNYAGVRPWIIGWLVVVAALAAGILTASLWRRHATTWSLSVGLALAGVALVSSSVWASGSVIVTGEGPFDTPYQPARITDLSQVLPTQDRLEQWPELNRYVKAFPPHEAIDVIETSFSAAYDVFATGREFLSVGGFTGEVPAPSLRQLITYVAEGRVVMAQAAVSPRSNNPDIRWIIAHCQKQTFGVPTFFYLGSTIQRYTCSSADGRAAQDEAR